jgi:PAS domain S-box-containing protein
MQTDDGRFGRKIKKAFEQVETLREKVEQDDVERARIAPEAIEALLESLEELHVAQEELTQINTELESTRLELETERYRYKELFDFAPDGYLITNPEGVISEANAAASILLGVNQEHLRGKPFSVFIAVEDKQDFFDRLNNLGDQSRFSDWELKITPRASVPFYASLTSVVTRSKDWEVTGLRWLMRDITGRRQAERELQQAYTQLEEGIESRTRDLQMMVNSVSGREARMLGLKKKIKSLQKQLHDAGISSDDDEHVDWME